MKHTKKTEVGISFKSLVFLLIGLFLLMMYLSSCASTPRYDTHGKYVIEYSMCPTYPPIKHYRAFGKRFNPNNCNKVYR